MVALAAIAVAIPTAALLVLGRSHAPHTVSGVSEQGSGSSSRHALVATLGVLRRAQTAADRRIPRFLRHPQAPLPGVPDQSLIRVATGTPWGKDVMLIPLKNTSPRVGAFGQETLLVFDGIISSCCDTVQQIRAEGGGGSTVSVGDGRVAVVIVVPDGVARIRVLVHYRHPITISAIVRNNVSAFYAPGYPPGLVTTMTWYGRNGAVIKQFTRPGF
jgi:hypothetical protein